MRARPAAGRRPWRRKAAIALLSCCGLLGPTVGVDGARAAPDNADRDLEPAPPWIFFDQPDPATAQEITELLRNSFADQNHVIVARNAFVLRYGVLSAPALRDVLAADNNEPYTWNAALTAYALRNRWGNARELWPLLPPLLDLADRASEPYRRAFAALALGAFRSEAFAPEEPERPDPLLVRVPEQEAQKHLKKLIEVLGRHVDDETPQVRVAVALALGKSGAEGARAALREEERLGESDLRDAAVTPRQAVLLAVGLLPTQDDEPIFFHALQDVQRDIRRAAALGVSLQALHDHRPGWTQDPKRMLRALKSPPIRPQLEDGAEAVFTRGVLAAIGVATDEWRELFTIARQPSTEEAAARSAAQALVFCQEPWFSKLAHQSVQEGVELKPTVLAALLLRIGMEASDEGIAICQEYLSNKAKNPRGKPEWDVRYFAAVGLLRALASGRVTDPARRERIIAALTDGVKKGLRPGPFRDALRELLDYEERPIRENPNYALPESRIVQVVQSFPEPNGFFARDIVDMAVVRLNEMIPVLFNVNSIKPGQPGQRDKSEMPRRFLKSAQENFPYFNRLDLQADRGRRPPPEMPPGGEPAKEVRRR